MLSFEEMDAWAKATFGPEYGYSEHFRPDPMDPYFRVMAARISSADGDTWVKALGHYSGYFWEGPPAAIVELVQDNLKQNALTTDWRNKEEV